MRRPPALDHARAKVSAAPYIVVALVSAAVACAAVIWAITAA
jgi:hypothetical protein